MRGRAGAGLLISILIASLVMLSLAAIKIIAANTNSVSGQALLPKPECGGDNKPQKRNASLKAGRAIIFYNNQSSACNYISKKDVIELGQLVKSLNNKLDQLGVPKQKTIIGAEGFLPGRRATTTRLTSQSGGILINPRQENLIAQTANSLARVRLRSLQGLDSSGLDSFSGAYGFIAAGDPQSVILEKEAVRRSEALPGGLFILMIASQKGLDDLTKMLINCETKCSWPEITGQTIGQKEAKIIAHQLARDISPQGEQDKIIQSLIP